MPATDIASSSTNIAKGSAQYVSLAELFNGPISIYSATVHTSDGKKRMFCGLKLNERLSQEPGSLLPEEGGRPKYAQIYFHDTQNEVKNRMSAFLEADSRTSLDEALTNNLIIMLDESSAVAQAFRMARDWSSNNAMSDCDLRLLAKVTTSRQYNTPNVAEVAALITGDFGHSIEEQRLKWLRHNQNELRLELYNNVCDAVTRGDTSATSIGKRIILPSSHTGSPRYMVQNYQDAMALCREYDNLNLFITFTSNPRWPEIDMMISYIAGQKSTDRPDIVSRTPAAIDDIITAEIPSEKDDPEGFRAVTEYMLHGPCGGLHMNAPCIIDRQCSKHFPKPYYAETTIDEDGYANYRRRNNGVRFTKNNTSLDNGSGPDRATIVIQENMIPGDDASGDKVIDVDEIRNYLDCRYLSPCEAVWRLFSFDIHYSKPSVIKLSYHLPNQQSITLHDSQKLPALLRRESIKETMFTQWFELNKEDDFARTLTYAKIPTHYVWNRDAKMWSPRKLRTCIGRIVYSNPASGERYYLRMLLNIVKGPRSFEDLRTVNGVLHPTFKDACFAYGLVNDDKEWTEAISEAKIWATGSQLRELFVTMLLFCNLTQPRITINIPKGYTCSYPKKGGLFFLYGPGGTGKTFLYNTILAKLRSESLIVLAVASSGIALLLLPGGRTAHSRFVIPLELMENSTCGIKQKTHLAALIQEARLIIWDEAPMTQRFAFKALDKTLRDILGAKDDANRLKLFGGMPILLGGDFRQILPVVTKGKRQEVVHVCINRSDLWQHCELHTLSRIMRVNECTADGHVDARKHEFNKWVLNVGEGKVPALCKDGEDELTWIQIPDEFIIKSDRPPIEAIVDTIFPNFINKQEDEDYLRERAILTPRNDDADEINKHMFKKLQGAKMTFKSSDEICKSSTDNIDQHCSYPVEFLNKLNFLGVPPHKLKLKLGQPIMLLRNLSPSTGMCNGTRLIITDFNKFVLQARIITGSHVGKMILTKFTYFRLLAIFVMQETVTFNLSWPIIVILGACLSLKKLNPKRSLVLNQPITGVKPEEMKHEDSNLLDRKALGVVRLSLAKDVAYNIVGETTTKGVLTALANMHEKPSALNKVFLIRHLVNAKMKERSFAADHRCPRDGLAQLQ
ncbi:uncharacterized protein [Rutidosis leptorrhynchoides]|uniref:uncharacterized protein n=1 Tax=Rutidosis leptorrhynchoides TaxID=125765 RepID=UPI003A9A0968